MEHLTDTGYLGGFFIGSSKINEAWNFCSTEKYKIDILWYGNKETDKDKSQELKLAYLILKSAIQFI